MQFTCKSCDEVWDEVPNPTEPLICCPVCGEVVAKAPPPPPARAAAPAPENIEHTIVNVAETTRVSPATGATMGAGQGMHTPPPATPPPPPPTHPSNLAPPPPFTPPTPSTDAIGEHTTRMVEQSAPSVSAPLTPVSNSGYSSPPPRTQKSVTAPTAATKTTTGGGLAGEMQHMIGKTISGYRIESLLGVGGMGAVFLAHQISLDRHVALKLLPARFAANAELLARFVREALSAAQLSHHNIVQVIDVGSEGDTHYISMEYVRGDTLAAGVKQDGRLQIDDAAGYVLQAARGLHYAHERGIVHRDIKPGNLMLNEHGIVKIADMGLAKMRGVAEKSMPNDGSASRTHAPHQTGSIAVSVDDELTRHDIAMGTPSYMAPEQARDASGVDARADQYSLGVTLYYLVAGKTPFTGNSAVELISKHQNEPPPPIEHHVGNVPPQFRAILEKMLAKKPDDRYATLADVVHALETFLGVESDKGPFTPREQHLALLDRETKAYYAAPGVKLRKLAVAAFWGLSAVLFFVSILVMKKTPQLFAGTVGLVSLAVLGNFVVNGFRTKAYIFRRVRSVFFGMPPLGWAKFIGGVIIVVFIFFALGWPASVFALLGIGLAALYQAGVIKPLLAQRTEPVRKVQEMLRELRMRGLAEEAVQDFVARFTGADWEELFEELFGYESMLTARAKWASGDQAAKRKKFGTWRDPLSRWLDSVEEARKSAREKKQLAKVEAQRLKAQGVKPQEAEKQAELEATRIIEADPARKLEERAKEIEVLKGKRHSRGKASLAYAAVRGLLGVLMLYGAGIYLFHLPDLTGGMISKFTSLGFQGTMVNAFVTLLAGTALLLSIFSHHVINTLMIVIGAILIASGPALAAASQQAMLGSVLGLGAGLLLAAAGIVFNILAKLAGKRF